jgi:hypothetical protein
MTHNNEITNSDNDFSTPPLNIVEGYRNQNADITDEHTPVVITLSAFHGGKCAYLPSAKMSREAELWETYVQTVFPCRACWTTTFIGSWHEQLRLRHYDCNSQSRLLRPSGFIVDKYATLPFETLRRVLSRNAESITHRMIVKELMGNGFETSDKAVRDAVDRKPPYDSSMFDRIYDAYAGY